MSYPFSRFDTSERVPLDVEEGYRIWSRNYDAMLTDNLDGPILEGFLDRLQGRDLDVVDLGSGTGRTGRWLRDRLDVRTLTGIDLSPEMLAGAEKKNLYTRLAVGEVTDTGLSACAFDRVVNDLSACHVPDLKALYAEAHRLLRTPGQFLLVDFHPHMLLSGVGTCFPDTEGNMVAIENHVHLLRDHTRAAAELGFAYAGFEESLITQEWLDQGLGKVRFLDHPIGFGFLWQKTPAGDGKG